MSRFWYDRALLMAVLIHHTRVSASHCACGWSELGRSFAEHVANSYEAALGVLSIPDPPPTSDKWPSGPDPSPESQEYLTPAEHQVVQLLAEAFTTWRGAGATGRDLAEFAQAIHHAQHQVLAQAAARTYPHLYRLAVGTRP